MVDIMVTVRDRRRRITREVIYRLICGWVPSEPTWVEESGIVDTSWYHLGLWRETAPKWIGARMGKGMQQQPIRGRSVTCRPRPPVEPQTSPGRQVSSYSTPDGSWISVQMRAVVKILT